MIVINIIIIMIINGIPIMHCEITSDLRYEE